MIYINSIIMVLKSFGQGIVEGIDMWQQMVKLPRWACWTLGLLTFPINILILIGILVYAGYDGLLEQINEARDFIKYEES